MNKDKILKLLKRKNIEPLNLLIFDDIILDNLPYDSYVCFIDDFKIGFYFIYERKLFKSYYYYDKYLNDNIDSENRFYIISNNVEIVTKKRIDKQINAFDFYNRALIEKFTDDFFKKLFDLNEFRYKVLFNYNLSKIIDDFYSLKKQAKGNLN